MSGQVPGPENHGLSHELSDDLSHDLDNSENIRQFIEAFYDKVLADELLRPIFIDVAGINLEEHLPRIRAYWEKLLLGRDNYHRHTMQIHRRVARNHYFSQAEFERWLLLFTQTADDHFAGPYTEKAKKIASSIAGNMQLTVNRNIPETN